MDGPHLRIRPRELVGDLRRSVRAPVVDDDHFEIRGEFRCSLHRADHHAGDGAAVVIRRKKDAQARWQMFLNDSMESGYESYVSRPISRHGATADSIRTARDSFDSPRRRSTKVIGTSLMRLPRRAAT